MKTIFQKRIEWLMCWISNNNNGFDMLNIEFVDSFIVEFNVPHTNPFYGARHCKTLSRFLSEAYKRGYLSRGRISISNGPGFPNWVYAYSVRKEYIGMDI